MTEYFLEQIHQFAKRKRITRLEKKRLGKDLETVFDRLRKKEYQKGGFTTNKFDVPDRTREFYIYLEFYCLVGKTWAAILKEFDIHRFSEVVDLCPGYTPKIELALFYLNYKGKVVLLDRDSAALTELTKFMELFHPSFTTVKKKTDFFRNVRRSYELVLANHVIDDFVIDYFSRKFNINSRDMYEKEGVFEGLWQKILKDKEKHFQEISRVICKSFQRIVKNRGWLFISHYKSYMEKLLDLNVAAAFNRALFKNAVKNLCQNGFVRHDEFAKGVFKKFRGHFGPRDCVVLQKKN